MICKKCGLDKPDTEMVPAAKCTTGFRKCCKACKAAYGKEYYLQHKDHHAVVAKAWYALNRDRHLAKSKQYRRNNKDRCAALDKQWSANNPGRRRAISRQWYADNKLRHMAVCRAWRDRNPVRVALYKATPRPDNYKTKKSAQAKIHIARTRERHREWVKRNAVHLKELYTRWRRANRARVGVLGRNRRARMRNACGSHTSAQITALWERQKHKCAIKNCPYPIAIDGPDHYHVDHVTPLARGGSNDIGNLQILCRTHNLQKSDRDEYEWAHEHGMLFPK